jgi:hypothetical protein
MLVLNAPAVVKETKEALKCIQERENADAECTCDHETKRVKKGSTHDSTYGLSIFWGYGSKDPALLFG